MIPHHLHLHLHRIRTPGVLVLQVTTYTVQPYNRTTDKRNLLKTSIMSNHEPIITWKHIGLHGYAVGTLAFYPDMIVWKSALSGRHDKTNHNDLDHDDDMMGNSNALTAMTTRKIPASKLKFAKWTPMGKNVGLLRLGITNATAAAASTGTSASKNPPPFQQDWRLDGFPATDYDLLSQKLQTLCHISLQNYIMSSAGTQYGIPSVSPTESQEKWLTLDHCVAQDDLNEEGQEFQILATNPICHFDLHEITQCVIPANNNRNEIELQFPETDTMEVGTDQLGNVCFLYVCILSCVFCVDG